MTNEQKNGIQPENYPLLEQIGSPDDLKALSDDQMEPLAKEIRAFLVRHVTETGGHLASNLGAVELTLAVHRVFSTPHDHVIFDVGHQSYVHKLLTGRREAFDTLRQGGGISGFPKRAESEHDCFGTGHSSTSLSAALGFAESDRLSGSDAYTVCILGDGAYTGGMIHEALNNCRKNLRLILIINENEMSISKNIGRFAKNLSHLRSSKSYFRTKSVTAVVLNHIPLIGAPIFRFLQRFKNAIKAALYGSNHFENLGFGYLGPVDGNDEAAVERLLREAISGHRSCVIHLKTQKGKGYAPAESSPDVYHGMAPAGKVVPDGTNFSEEMGNVLCNLAAKNQKICAITAAMASGCGLTKFRGQYRPRFFDVGIAEEHAVTFAAGLAANGYRPVVAVYSTFLQRAYDNILHDVALQNLPVVFCVDRAGLNASDGATHHGIFDVAFLSQVPGLKIYTPLTRQALARALDAALRDNCPSAIRYPNGYEDPLVVDTFYSKTDSRVIGVRNDGSFEDPEALDAVIVTDGRIVTEAIKAKAALAGEEIKVGILLLEQIKPYPVAAEQVLSLLPEKACPVLFLEEEIRAGGMGMMLSEAMSRDPKMANKAVRILATDETFVIQSRKEPIYQTAKIDAGFICRAIRDAGDFHKDFPEEEEQNGSTTE